MGGLGSGVVWIVAGEMGGKCWENEHPLTEVGFLRKMNWIFQHYYKGQSLFDIWPPKINIEAEYMVVWGMVFLFQGRIEPCHTALLA